jgi:hypothetical protein
MDLKARTRECTIVLEQDRDLINSYESFKMENGITTQKYPAMHAYYLMSLDGRII